MISRLESELGARYEDFRLMTTGGMGHLVSARSLLEGIDVVVKVPRVLRDGAASHEVLTRFLREARAIACLAHPFIVRVLEVGRLPETPYFVMEYVNGNTLERLLAGPRPMEPCRVLGIGIDLCEALIHIHERGILHRDLKPANLILTPDDHLKLIDFGLSRMQDETTEITRVGQVMGTLPYMAPEQIEGRPTDPRTDLHAVGTLLYRAATGRLPFSIASSTLANRGPADPPSRFNPEISPRLDEILLKTLSREAAQRPPSALTLRRALVECLREYGERAPLPPHVPFLEATISEASIPGSGSSGPESDRIEDGTVRELVLIELTLTVEDRESGRPRALNSRLLSALGSEIAARGARVEYFEPAGFLASFGRDRNSGQDAEIAANTALLLRDRVTSLTPVIEGGSGHLTARILVDAVRLDPLRDDPLEPRRRRGGTRPLEEGIWVRSELAGRIERTYWLDRHPAPGLPDHRRLGGLRSRGQVLAGDGTLARSPQLARLGRCWQEHFALPAAGRPTRVVEIRGQTGLGKSLLVDGFLRDLRETEVRILEGTTSGTGAGTGGLIRSLLLDAMGVSGSVPETESKAALVTLLDRLRLREEMDRDPEPFEGLCRLLHLATPSDRTSPQQARDQAARGARRLLRRLLEEASDVPHIVVLEDFQAIDELSLAILDAAIGESRGIFCIVTHVPPCDLPHRWRMTAPLETIELAPLDPVSARTLLDDRLRGAGVRENLRDAILEKAGGNPLFITELARWVLEHRDGRHDRIPLPGSIQALVLARLDGLSRTQRETLQLAAVIGMRPDPVILETAARSLRGFTPRTAEEVLSHLESRGFLEREPGTQRITFASGVIREGVLGSILPRNRRELHRKVVRAMESLSLEIRDPERMAHHALGSGDPEQAADYLEQAVEQSVARDETRRTLFLTRNLLEILAGFPAAPELVDRLEAMGRLTPAVLTRTIQALLHQERACERLGRSREQKEVLAILDSSRGSVGAAPHAGTIESRLSRHAWLHTGDLVTAARHARAALIIARESGSPAGRAEAHRNIGCSASLAGRTALALRHHRRACSLFHASGDRAGVASALCSLAINSVSLGLFSQGLDLMERAHALEVERGDRRGIARALRIHGDLERVRGDATGARAHYLHALELEREIGYGLGEAQSLCRMGSLANDLGDPETALEHYKEALAVARTLQAPALIAECQLGLSLGYLARGSQAATELAMVCGRNGLDLALHLAHRGLEVLALTRLAASTLALGLLEEADALTQRALVRGGECVWPQVREEEIWWERHRVLAALSRAPEADQARERAAALLERRLASLPDEQARRAWDDQDRLHRAIRARAAGPDRCDPGSRPVA